MGRGGVKEYLTQQLMIRSVLKLIDKLSDVAARLAVYRGNVCGSNVGVNAAFKLPVNFGEPLLNERQGLCE